jgi:tryptophan 2-monooxygenase
VPALVPNRAPRPVQAQPDAFPGWPYIDTLYDYTKILGGDTPIATLPADARGARIAVVGAGAAGMVAAYELLRMGASPHVFEASDRVGGRNWSEPFAGSPMFAEMGAMRVPVSSKVFWSYADAFGLSSMEFPDPGKVPTLLYYENEALEWRAGQLPPGRFAQIQKDWDDFTSPFAEQINQAWRDGGGDPAALQPVWQGLVDKYASTSFYQALVEGIPQWGPEERNAFGALGIGSGGFGPLYDVGFLEMLRLIVNQLEVSQLGIEGGISGLTHGFLTTPVLQPDGRKTSLERSGALSLKCEVTKIACTADGPQLTWTDAQGREHAEDFAAVIVATTSRAMEFLGLTLPTPGGTDALSEPVRVALRTLHMMSSSKLFIRTSSKFWKQSGLPWNIQTDEAVRGLYTLDYPDTDEGVVLISYTWGDDSDKLLPLDPQARLATFVRTLEAISPGFASRLTPESGEVLDVDWQAEPHYFGAFKLNLPGQDFNLQSAYFQFQTAGTPQDTGVYVAGDGVSWLGGWTEGALQTGLNAACAAATRLGGTFPNGSPVTDQKSTLYDYAPSVAVATG